MSAAIACSMSAAATYAIALPKHWHSALMTATVVSKIMTGSRKQGGRNSITSIQCKFWSTPSHTVASLRKPNLGFKRPFIARHGLNCMHPVCLRSMLSGSPAAEFCRPCKGLAQSQKSGRQPHWCWLYGAAPCPHLPGPLPHTHAHVVRLIFMVALSALTVACTG